jgi:hypothetical protein
MAWQNVSFGMPRKRNRRYLIEIKDAKGVSVFFTAADWSDGERRAAVAQILRLNGVPEVYGRPFPQSAGLSGAVDPATLRNGPRND